MDMDILLYCIVFIVGALTGFFISKKSSSNNFEKLTEMVQKEFSYIASRQINDEKKEILEQNQTAVKMTLEPLNKQIEDFKKEIDNYRESHTKNTGEISQKLSDLTQKSIMLSETAQNLSDALTKNRNVKGWYGEDLAQRILENSGFIEGIHFSVQHSENSKRPDFEVYLPDNRCIVIDSKAILSSIVDYDKNENGLKDVINAVKARAKELSDKEYQNIEGLRQPEFVLMYIPIEPVVNLLYTTKEGMEIIENARKNRVVITGSVSLVTVINLIELIWKENDRIQNLDEIVETGTKLYEAVSKHAEELGKIQKAITDAKNFTDETISRLCSSSARINIFKEAEKLKGFGISSPNEIPDNLIND